MYRNTLLREWERQHPEEEQNSNKKGGSRKRLYTDENPATTIKGTGFKDRLMAERTIFLTSQKGVRYKQYWTIKAMRERAAHHPHPTSGMRDAIAVFDKWLVNEERKPLLNLEERKEREQEWKKHRKLCASSSNHHCYGLSPSREQLQLARNDLKEGRECLWKSLALAQSPPSINQSEKKQVMFPLAAFTALFGGPGLHGYGNHTITDISTATANLNFSIVLIHGIYGLYELLPNKKKIITTTMGTLQTIKVHYDRQTHTTQVDITYDKSEKGTLLALWKRDSSSRAVAKTTTPTESKDKATAKTDSPSWCCTACTFEHVGSAKQLYLACELCGNSRRNKL